jgi:hypothetical protein
MPGDAPGRADETRGTSGETPGGRPYSVLAYGPLIDRHRPHRHPTALTGYTKAAWMGAAPRTDFHRISLKANSGARSASVSRFIAAEASAPQAVGVPERDEVQAGARSLSGNLFWFRVEVKWSAWRRPSS